MERAIWWGKNYDSLWIEDRSSEAGYAKASLIACGLVLWVNAPRTATRSALIVSGVGSRTVARSGFLAVLGIDDRQRIASLLPLFFLPLFFLSPPSPRRKESPPRIYVPRDPIKATNAEIDLCVALVGQPSSTVFD